MISLIRSTCLWGRENYSQWTLARVGLIIYGEAPPVSSETRLIKGNRKIALIQTDGYDIKGTRVQSLTLVLTAPELLQVHPPSPVPPQSVKKDFESTRFIIFTSAGLNEFLRKSGDTNTIHKGESPIVPGLWILQRLWDISSHKMSPGEFNIRFLHPLPVDQKIRLCFSGNRISGIYKGYSHFIMNYMPETRSE